MLDQLLHVLVHSKNEAADDVLVEALRLGDEYEKRPVLEALLYRKSIHGLCSIVAEYGSLSELLQQHVLSEIKVFHPALRVLYHGLDRRILSMEAVPCPPRCVNS